MRCEMFFMTMGIYDYLSLDSCLCVLVYEKGHLYWLTEINA